MRPDATAAPAPAVVLVGRFAELEDALAERVRERRVGAPLTPLTIVVGSASLRTRVGHLLVCRLGALANVSVVTLARFGRDLVTHSRGAPPVVLGSLARERLVRRLVARQAACGLAYYGPVWRRPHFAQALAATFDDLRQALVEPDSGWVAAVDEGAPAAAGGTAVAAVSPGETGAAAAARRAKAADLEALYAAYCGELERRGLFEAAQVQREAARTVREGGLHEGVVLYGIYDVNRAQEELVAALLDAGCDMFVPLPRGGDEQLATALTVAGGRRAVERLPAPPPARTLDRIVSVLSRGRGPTAADPPALEDDGSLVVVSVADERDEAREAVRSVLQAAGRGVPLRDCAVIVPHGDDIERFAAAFRAAEVRVACDLPDRGDGARVLRRLVECLAPEAGRPFARRAVVDLLLAAPLRRAPAPHETALWLDEARQAGVVAGLDEWAERLARRAGGLRRRCTADEAEAVGAGDDDAESCALVRRRAAAADSLLAAVVALQQAAGRLPAEGSWQEWAEALDALVVDLFDEATAGAARDAVGRLRALGALDERVDVAEFASVLRELLAARTVREGRVTRDGVALLTPLELRGHRFHEVVFTGLAEGGFPAHTAADPVLGDAERRAVARRCGTRLPLAEARDAESALLFSLAAEAARERLTLLVPRSDAASGRPRLPSRLLLRLASAAAGAPVTLDEFLSGGPLRPVWRRTGGTPEHDGPGTATWIDAREFDTAALLALSGGRHDPRREYLASVLGDAPAAERRLARWRAGLSTDVGVWDGLLGQAGRAALAALGARHPFATELHPTRVERYVTCPFSFYLRDVLGLEAPEESAESVEMEQVEFGTLAHDILERTYRRVIDEGLDLEGARRALVASWEEGCAEAERRGVTGAPLAWEVRRQVLRDDLLTSVGRDPVFGGAGERPLAVELRFGRRHDRPVTLELGDGRELRFAGRLDRVDAVPGGARVIDYKTGGGSAEQKLLKRRLGVQLPVYQLAVRRIMGEEYGQVTALYRLVTRKGDFRDLPLPDDEAAARTRLAALLDEVLALVDAGVFPRTSAERCEYCDIAYACGFSAWARDRKREHERLAALVRLQTEGPAETPRGTGAAR